MLGKRTEGSSLYVLYSGGTPSPWRVHTHTGKLRLVPATIISSSEFWD